MSGAQLLRSIVLLLIAGAIATTASAQEVINGTTAEGALYEFVVPGGWNGTLVVYSHGMIDPQLPLALPAANDDFASLRDALVANGYAVASSSWSENGFAAKDGFVQTHKLRGLFTSQVAQPKTTILIGKSLGGLVATKLIERYPGQYDGALVMCGVVGGSAAEVKYLADSRILFDYFFPGVLLGDAFHIPTQPFAPGTPAFNAVAQALQVGFFIPSQPTLQYFSTARLPASNPTEIVISALQTIGFNLRYGNNLLQHTNEHIPYDNTSVSYTGSGNDTALNSGVERFSSQPDAINYLRNYYEPTGELQAPVLTMHTVLDPVVPIFNESFFLDTVTKANAADLLVQQQVRRYGHCAFKLEEQLNSFNALTVWVSDRTQKPNGGDITLP
jgi:pimeloyl-ACP methyl ester carboxylesterase